MKVLIIGLGVIGTTYGYVFQKEGHKVEHLIRDSKKAFVAENINVKLLDGRFNNKGEEKMIIIRSILQIKTVLMISY